MYILGVRKRELCISIHHVTSDISAHVISRGAVYLPRPCFAGLSLGGGGRMVGWRVVAQISPVEVD